MNNGEFKRYIKYFAVWFIVLAVILGAYGSFYYMSKTAYSRNYYASPNTERVHGDRRVFDYGDQLTDLEEAKLEAYIAEAEKKTCVDIVIITLDESLKDFAAENEKYCDYVVTPDKYVAVYAEKFWRDNKFGYDRPQVLDGTARTGHGTVLIDNVFREPETNRIYTWMTTVGRCEQKYSSEMIDYALDRFYDYVSSDYYRACVAWVDVVAKDMSIAGADVSPVTPVVPAGIAVITFLIFYFSNRNSKAGSVTTSNTTYMIGHKADFTVREDIFLTKNVKKIYNPPSSSSGGGGGGGHHSSGGGSYGGGGHSR